MLTLTSHVKRTGNSLGKAGRVETFVMQDDHSLQGKHGKSHPVC